MLPAGTKLGPYEIVAAIGAGGMGEVYKARDTRLDRIVAIKVLPPVLALDPQFRERFDREAKSISSLSHPNICALYDVGEGSVPAHEAGLTPSVTTAYLVMEFLDGETLAARLTRGALPMSEALKIAMEIAGALDKAHRQGIVHRDLKPGNVMLTKTGSKLLDFGLAKIGPSGVLSAAASTVLATSPRPTQAPPLTAQGTILGTFQYMSPEQVEGEQVDARSDIFSFGALLYEMVTGRKAFTGKSQASLLGALLKDDPPPASQVQPLAPPALDYLIRTCLAKDPEGRFQTAHDLLLQLKWIAEGGSAAGAQAPTAHRHSRERVAWIVAATLGVALAVTATVAVKHVQEKAPDADPLQFTVTSPENSLFSGVSPQFAASPDGRHLVFVASAQSAAALWIRPLGALTAHPLPGTEGALFPFWSPDSRFVGFFASGKLKKVAVSGGPAIALCDASNGRGGTWNQDNVILFAPIQNGPLHRVTSAGGTSVAITEPEPDKPSHRWPAFLPDGRHYLFLAGLAGVGGEIRIGALDSKEVGLVATADSRAAYSSGHVLFVRDESLMALPFDLVTKRATADPFPVAQPVGVDLVANGSFSTSSTGVLMYAQGGSRPVARLTWFDRSGTRVGTAGDPGAYFNVSLSRDERRVAMSFQSGTPGNRDVWLLDLARGGALSRFSFDPAQDGVPIWSHDDSRIGFISNRNGPWNIYVKAAGGIGQEELAWKSDTTNYVTDWSRDGRFLAFSNQSAANGLDLWVLPTSGDKKAVPFLQTPFIEDNSVFSPDGRWIAYDSNESGRTEVYIRPYPGPGGQYMVSRSGGAQPMWRGDGGELFFLAVDGTLFSAAINSATGFEAGVPKALFPTGAVLIGNRRQYAVTRDGKRFLVNEPQQRTSPAAIAIVVNWPATIQR